MEVMTNSTGSLKISRDVIATIAGCAATEIEGVAALAPFTSGLTTGWVLKARSSLPVAVTLNDDVACIDINLNLEYGAYAVFLASIAFSASNLSSASSPSRDGYDL